MKRTISFLLLFLLPMAIMAQTKVAVYVVNSAVDDGIKTIIGSEMVSAIVANKDFQAVERTPVFLEQLSKEKSIGDDQQISQIGKQIGVDNVCVVDITSFQSSYYIQARLLEVNEAVVLAAAREISPLSGIEDIVTTTEKLASKLIGDDAIANQVGMDYSTIGYVPNNTKHLHLISIDNTGTNTVLLFKYCKDSEGGYCIRPEAYLYNKQTDKRYRLIKAESVSNCPKITNKGLGIHEFTLFFEKIPQGTNNIDFIESEDGWCLYDIELKPYGKRNYHEFIDNSIGDYESISLQYQQRQEQQRKQQEQQRRQQEEDQRIAKEAGENLGNAITGLLTYELKVMNTKLFPRMIWVGDRCCGVVKANSEATFRVPTSCYGSAKSVQTEGYVFYPTTETFYIQKPYGGQTVIWIIK